MSDKVLCKFPLFFRKYKVLLALVLVCVLSGSIGFTIAQSTNSFVISDGVYGGAPSFTVWADGVGGFYSKNAYGVGSYSGSDWDVVMDSVFGALDGVGGSVFVKFGSYVASEDMTVPSDVVLYSDGAVISLSANDYVFSSIGDNIVIDGFVFDNSGNYISACVNLYQASNVRVVNCRFDGYGSLLDSGDSNNRFVSMNECDDIEIAYNIVNQAGNFGNSYSTIWVTSSSNECTGINIHHNTFYDGSCPIVVNAQQGNTEIVFANNYVDTTTTTDGIDVLGCVDAKIVDNYFMNVDYVGIALECGGSSDISNILVQGNHIGYTGGTGITVCTYGAGSGAAHEILIDGNVIWNSGQGSPANPKDASGIYVYDSASHVTVTSNNCYDNQGSATQKYGIYMEDNAYNMVVGCNAWDNDVADIWGNSGGNLEIHCCYNGTSWVT